MIILAISGCLLNSMLPQCGVVYVRINSYHDIESCFMRAAEILENDTHFAITKKAICLDWRRSDNSGIQKYLNMLGGYHPKTDA